MKNINRLVFLALAVMMTWSCAGEDGMVRKNFAREKKECYRENMTLMMTGVKVPPDFQSFYETFARELPIGEYKRLAVELEAGHEYFFGAKTLPKDELIRFYLLEGESVEEIKGKIHKGIFLQKIVSATPQIYYTPQKTGIYQIITQTHFSACTDKVLISLAVARKKESKK